MPLSPYGAVTAAFLADLRAAVGAEHVRTDEEARATYGADALKKGHPADVVVWPADTADVSAVLRVCTAHRVPVVPRGAGTGYTGGAVPSFGGVVLSLQRLNRILEIDERNLLAVAECHVVTGDLQKAVEAVGLFYPPDPGQPVHLHDRRQRRRVCRWPARVQVRRDQALHPGPRGRARLG